MAKKGMYILIGTLMVYGLLVATHKGEFWPFSIYPMFSQAGAPWTHTLVRKVSNNAVSWANITRQKFPGNPFALNDIGLDQNDLLSYVIKNKQWTPQKIKGLRNYFQKKLTEQSFLIFKVHGKITDEDEDSVAIIYIPYIYLQNDTTLFNPKLVQSDSVVANL